MFKQLTIAGILIVVSHAALAVDANVKYAVEANIRAIEIFLTMDGDDEALRANALNLFRTIKAPNLPVPENSIDAIGRRSQNPAYAEPEKQLMLAIETNGNFTPEEKRQMLALISPQSGTSSIEDSWYEKLIPKLTTRGSRVFLSYADGGLVEVNPKALNAMWLMLPDLAYKNIDGKNYLYLGSCQNMTPSLSMLSLIGLKVTPNTIGSLGLTKEAFDKWMQLYLTIGNAWEMGYATCNRPMYYLHVMWPDMVGANWRAGMNMLSSTRQEKNTMYLTWLPQWQTQLTFQRHGHDKEYWQVGIRSAQLNSGGASGAVSSFLNSLMD